MIFTFEKCPEDLSSMSKKERDDFFDACGSPGEIRCLFDERGVYTEVPFTPADFVCFVGIPVALSVVISLLLIMVVK